MKTKITRLFVIFLLIIFNSEVKAQSEYFVYCDPEVGYDTIVKIDEVLNGDTLVKTFKDLLLGGETFEYYFYNDSIFSKYEGEYYFLGANQAEIGDIWEPVWYFGSYSLIEAGGPLTRTLKVIDKEPIEFGEEIRMKYTLEILDIGFDEYPSSNGYEFLLSFIEGIGAIDGGPYYNLNTEASYYPCFHCIAAVFISYHNGEDSYDEGTECIITSGIDYLTKNDKLTYKVIDNVLYMDGTDEVDGLTIYNLMGEMVKTSSHNYIDVNGLSGIYLVQAKRKGTVGYIKVFF